MTRPPLNTRFHFISDPFKIEATVTEHTARGFNYRYDEPIHMGRPYWGTSPGGEVFCDVEFYDWTKHVTILPTT